MTDYRKLTIKLLEQLSQDNCKRIYKLAYILYINR